MQKVGRNWVGVLGMHMLTIFPAERDSFVIFEDQTGLLMHGSMAFEVCVWHKV